MNEEKDSGCSCPYCDGGLFDGLCSPCDTTIRNCTECGKLLPKDAKECPECGASCAVDKEA